MQRRLLKIDVEVCCASVILLVFLVSKLDNDFNSLVVVIFLACEHYLLFCLDLKTEQFAFYTTEIKNSSPHKELNSPGWCIINSFENVQNQCEQKLTQVILFFQPFAFRVPLLLATSRFNLSSPSTAFVSSITEAGRGRDNTSDGFLMRRETFDT